MFASVLFMSSFDVTIDPVFEELAKFCIDDVGQPLTRQQVDFFLVRQIQHQIGKLFSFLEHSSYADILILRAVNGGVLILLNTCKFEL